MSLALSLSFTIYNRDHTDIGNDRLYTIRREVALAMENAEFGHIIEHDDHFENLFAAPDTDHYYIPENELFISYLIPYAQQQGNIAFLLKQSIPTLYHIINELDMDVVTRIIIGRDR